MYTTRKSMLEAIREGDEVSWQEFYETYRPLVLHCAHRKRLSENDCEELLQNVMLKVFQARQTFRYDPTRGLFRNWLGRLIRNAMLDLFRQRKPYVELEKLPAETIGATDDQFQTDWETEWRHHILSQAMTLLRRRVEPDTFQAFELVALQCQKAAKVATFLNCSVQRIYDAKFRCIAQLRTIVEELDPEDKP